MENYTGKDKKYIVSEQHFSSFLPKQLLLETTGWQVLRKKHQSLQGNYLRKEVLWEQGKLTHVWKNRLLEKTSACGKEQGTLKRWIVCLLKTMPLLFQTCTQICTLQRSTSTLTNPSRTASSVLKKTTGSVVLADWAKSCQRMYVQIQIHVIGTCLYDIQLRYVLK